MHRHLLKFRIKDNGLAITLYVVPDNIGERFVTWASRQETPEDTFEGHYFKSLEEALEDWKTR